jgi:uncharacterized protein (DUF885 family)
VTRGKYAARAANARAENAQDTVAELRQQLAAEQKAHAADTEALRAQIARLEATLRREVGFMALEKINELNAEHEEQLAHLREQVAEARAYARKFKDGFDRATEDLMALAKTEASTRAGKAQLLTDLLRGERAGVAEGAPQ